MSDDTTPEERRMIDAFVAAGRVQVIPRGVVSEQAIEQERQSQVNAAQSIRRKQSVRMANLRRGTES